MMSRKFTTREKVLLIICAVLLLGIFYYKFVYVDLIEASKQYDIESIQSEVDLTQIKLIKMHSMQEEIAAGGSGLNGVVATYNNLQNEITILNILLAAADTYNLDFSDATLTGTTVRRDISVSFHTASYRAAKDILQNLTDCQYRCMIKDLNIATTSSQATGIQSSGDLNVSFVVTFYETTTGATTTAGLITEDTTAADAAPEDAQAATE